MSMNRNGPSPLGEFVRRNRNELGLLAAVLAVLAFVVALDGSYRANPEYNAKELLRQTAMLGIFALGAAIVIISGGIDLSSGAVIALSSTVCASILFALAPQNDFGDPVTRDLGLPILAAAILGTLFVAFLIGSFHAWLITAVGLPPFVATLASLVGLRSLARVLVQDVSEAVSGKSMTKLHVYDENFRMLGTEWWIPVAVFLAISLGLWLLMSRTVAGRHLYAMGGNEQAARLSGIRTERLKWLAYCIGSMTAAVAGILYTAEVSTANPASLAVGYELNAIAAAVVGGCSLSGGIGTIGGTMLGALFLRTVIDAVNKTVKVGSADDYEGLIVGILVVLAVAFNALRTSGGLARRFFPGGLGVVNIANLTLLGGVVVGVLSPDAKFRNGAAAAGIVFFLLCLKKYLEAAAERRMLGR